MQTGADLNLIGQFGVGIYPIYLVASMLKLSTSTMMTNNMCGSQKMMDHLLSSRIHGMDHVWEYLEKGKLKAWVVVAVFASRCSGRSIVSLAICGIFVPDLAEAVVHPELLPVSTRSCNSDLLLLLPASTPGASARLASGAPTLEPGPGKVCTDQVDLQNN